MKKKNLAILTNKEHIVNETFNVFAPLLNDYEKAAFRALVEEVEGSKFPRGRKELYQQILQILSRVGLNPAEAEKLKELKELSISFRTCTSQCLDKLNEVGDGWGIQNDEKTRNIEEAFPGIVGDLQKIRQEYARAGDDFQKALPATCDTNWRKEFSVWYKREHDNLQSHMAHLAAKKQYFPNLYLSRYLRQEKLNTVNGPLFYLERVQESALRGPDYPDGYYPDLQDMDRMINSFEQEKNIALEELKHPDKRLRGFNLSISGREIRARIYDPSFRLDLPYLGMPND